MDLLWIAWINGYRCETADVLIRNYRSKFFQQYIRRVFFFCTVWKATWRFPTDPLLFHINTTSKHIFHIMDASLKWDLRDIYIQGFGITTAMFWLQWCCYLEWFSLHSFDFFMIHMYYVMLYMCNAAPHHSLYGCFRGVRYFVILVLNTTFFRFLISLLVSYFIIMIMTITGTFMYLAINFELQL